MLPSGCKQALLALLALRPPSALPFLSGPVACLDAAPLPALAPLVHLLALSSLCNAVPSVAFGSAALTGSAPAAVVAVGLSAVDG